MTFKLSARTMKPELRFIHATHFYQVGESPSGHAASSPLLELNEWRDGRHPV
jgi:hypothetical protein